MFNFFFIFFSFLSYKKYIYQISYTENINQQFSNIASPEFLHICNPLKCQTRWKCWWTCTVRVIFQLPTNCAQIWTYFWNFLSIIFWFNSDSVPVSRLYFSDSGHIFLSEFCAILKKKCKMNASQCSIVNECFLYNLEYCRNILLMTKKKLIIINQGLLTYIYI